MASGDILVRIPGLAMSLGAEPGNLSFNFNLNGDITVNSWPAGVSSTGTIVNGYGMGFNFAFSDSTDTPAIGVDPTAKYTITITQD